MKQPQCRKKDKEKTTYLMEKFNKYQTKEISRSEFIRTVGYKFAAITDL